MKKFTEFTLTQYLNELSSDQPIPGGGSVSAYAASLAMGLTQMVARISLKRPKKKSLTPEENQKDDERRATLQKMVDSIEKVKKDAFQIVDLDPQVYGEVLAASGDENKMEESLMNSFRLQADLTFLVVMAREWNKEMVSLVQGSIANDLLVAAALYEAAFKGAYHTAMINVKYMKSEKNRKTAEEAIHQLKIRYEQGNAHAGK